MEFDFSMFSLGILSVLCLGIYALVFVVRTAVETVFKNIKENKYWRDLVLPVLGIVFGIIFGLIMKDFPWPDSFSSLSARTLLSAVCGLISSFVYGRFKAWLKSSASVVPGSSEEEKTL
jgi:protein-S-isoprenylcysteine O-methyltransferase Ste14